MIRYIWLESVIVIAIFYDQKKYVYSMVGTVSLMIFQINLYSHKYQ